MFLIGMRGNRFKTPSGNPWLRNDELPITLCSIYARTIGRPIPWFMTQVIESVKGLEKRRSKSSDRESLNWLLKLKFFANDFFLATTGLLILKNFTKGT